MQTATTQKVVIMRPGEQVLILGAYKDAENISLDETTSLVQIEWNSAEGQHSWEVADLSSDDAPGLTNEWED